MSRGAVVSVIAFAALVGCHADASPRPAATAPAAPASSPDASAPDAGCEADVATRAPGAELVSETTLDLDGDGVSDRVYRSGHDIFGNAEYLFYRVVDGCAKYVGTISAFITSTPYCARPAPRPGVCRLVASERMYHDDYQETFYEYRAGVLEKVGHGEYTPPPSRPRR